MFAEEDSNLMMTGSSWGKGGKEIGLHVEAQRSVQWAKSLGSSLFGVLSSSAYQSDPTQRS